MCSTNMEARLGIALQEQASFPLADLKQTNNFCCSPPTFDLRGEDGLEQSWGLENRAGREGRAASQIH